MVNTLRIKAASWRPLSFGGRGSTIIFQLPTIAGNAPYASLPSARRVCCALYPSIGQAETKDEWIALGARIHGAFGPFIPVGIRIVLDAVEKLKPEPRGLSVIYYNGTKPPCGWRDAGNPSQPGAGHVAGRARCRSPLSRSRGTCGTDRHQKSEDRRGPPLHLTGSPNTRLAQVGASSPFDAAAGTDGLFTVEPVVASVK
jgi:hypothetical protein